MSVSSNVGIANLALVALGANQITSFTENTEEGYQVFRYKEGYREGENDRT